MPFVNAVKTAFRRRTALKRSRLVVCCYLFINTPQSKRRASGERPPRAQLIAGSMRKRQICLLLVAKLAPFGFWSGHGTRASGKISAIIRSVHPWKLPHLASASLLTAASEVLSISSSSPAPSALSDVRLYTTPRWVTPSPSMHGHYAHISQH